MYSLHLSTEDNANLEMSCRWHMAQNAAQLETKVKWNKDVKEGKIIIDDVQYECNTTTEPEQIIGNYQAYVDEINEFKGQERKKCISFLAAAVLFPLGLYLSLYLTAKSSLIIGCAVVLPGSIALGIFLSLFCGKRRLVKECKKVWENFKTHVAIEHVRTCRQKCSARLYMNKVTNRKMQLLLTRRIVCQFILDGNSVTAESKCDGKEFQPTNSEPSDKELEDAQKAIKAAHEKINAEYLTIRR